jgi:hypothetical protein
MAIQLRSGRSALDSRWIRFVSVFALALAIIVLRRPDAILNPQFWAEDGRLFYADAYNRGIIAPLLSLPKAGYLVLFPRLIAAFSQIFPLSWAPLTFTFAAFALRIMPVGLILSSRFYGLIPDWKTRLLLSFLYLNLPNSWEVSASLASAQFHLALLAFMVLSAGSSSRPLWHIFDTCIILLSGLSGPFCALLTPIAALFWFFRRDKRSLTFFAVIGICTVIQGIFLMTGEARP